MATSKRFEIKGLKRKDRPFKLNFWAKTLKAIGYKIIAATPQEASRSVGIITLNFSLKRKVKIFFKGQFILVGWLKPPPK